MRTSAGGAIGIGGELGMMADTDVCVRRLLAERCDRHLSSAEVALCESGSGSPARTIASISPPAYLPAIALATIRSRRSARRLVHAWVVRGGGLRAWGAGKVPGR